MINIIEDNQVHIHISSYFKQEIDIITTTSNDYLIIYLNPSLLTLNKKSLSSKPQSTNKSILDKEKSDFNKQTSTF